MDFFVETERLRIRPLQKEDAGFILELLNTPGWLQYIGDRDVHTIAAATDYISAGPLNSYLKNGFGLYLVSLKNHPVPIGICGLIRRPHWTEIDLGFAFLPHYTGFGYALEAATVILKEEHGRQLLKRVIAITLEENSASIRLLEKLGFVFEKKIIYEPGGEELLQFAIHFQDGLLPKAGA